MIANHRRRAMVADDRSIAVRHLDAAGAIRSVAMVANHRPAPGPRSAVIADHDVGNGRLAIAATWIDDGKGLAGPVVGAVVPIMPVIIVAVVVVMAMMTVVTMVVVMAMMTVVSMVMPMMAVVSMMMAVVAVMPMMTVMMPVVVVSAVSERRCGLPRQNRRNSKSRKEFTHYPTSPFERTLLLC
jgi:hypothetical protein